MNRPFQDLEKVTQGWHFYHGGILARVTGVEKATSWENRTFPKFLMHPQQALILPKQNQPFLSFNFSHISLIQGSTLKLTLETSSGREKLQLISYFQKSRILSNMPFRNHISCILIYALCLVSNKIWFSVAKLLSTWKVLTTNWGKCCFQTSFLLLSFLFLLISLKLIRVN